MSKILKSSAIILVALAAVGGATYSFFSDTETSTGNTFTSGAIDLKIDSVSHYNGMVCTLVGQTYRWIPEANVTLNSDNQPVVGSDMDETNDWNVYNSANAAQYPAAGVTCTGTWPLADLAGQPAIGKFFNFVDLKPGDGGENTISIHVDSNDAWMCASLGNVGGDDLDATKTEPEVSSPDVTFGSTAADSELDENLYFFAWVDDGDNIYEPQQTSFVETSLGNPVPASTLVNGTWTLAAPGFNGGAPIAGGTTQYIGVQWCAGTLVVGPTGITCNGAGMGNVAQTDSWFADLSFYVEQARNNPNFVCPQAVQRQTVGAALGAYVAPVETCTVTVTDGQSIQGAIDAAAAGSTICVGPGTHDTDTYPLRVNKDNLTLASTAGAATTILNGGVILDNDGTKVTGFTISSSTLLGETFGTYINTGVDGAVVSYNDMNGPGVASGRGVVNATGTTTTALIANNEISNYLTGVFLNPSASMIVELNDLVNNGVGSGNDNPTANTIRKNQITGNTIEGIGVLSSGAESIVVNNNNIFGNGGGANELNSYAVDAINAENNWWGDVTPADEIGGAGAASVDFTPFEVAAFVQN